MNQGLDLYTALAGLGVALHFSAEFIMRRGRGRSHAIGPQDRGTSYFTMGLNNAGLVWIFGARALAGPGPLPLGPIAATELVTLIFLGAALRYWSMYTLGEYFSRTLVTHDDQQVIDRGPYRWVRNPGYLANFIVMICAATVVPRSLFIPAVLFVLFALVYRKRIKAEEAMLRERFGQEFEDYCQRTPWRLMPLVY